MKITCSPVFTFLFGCSVLLQAHVAIATQQTEDQLLQTIQQHRYAITQKQNTLAGDGWEFLVRQGKQAQYFLLGEEHGIAENPQLTAALYQALLPAGYQHLAIETSPQMAQALEQAALQGMEGLRTLYRDPGKNAVFFGMQEEAQMLVDIRNLHGPQERVFWGLDYEVLADRHLINQLQSYPKPPKAENALLQLRAASDEAWTKYEDTRNPQYIFSFFGKPTLVEQLRNNWPKATSGAIWLLDTLQQTLLINQTWVQGNGYESNKLRSSLMRNNFIRYWLQHQRNKVFIKMGASHLVRGKNFSNVFDLGAMLPEVAAMSKKQTFHLLVLPGEKAETAVFDPTRLKYQAQQPKDGYGTDLGVFYEQVFEKGFTLFDTLPLRPIIHNKKLPEHLRKMVFGFDAILIMTGSGPSDNLL